VDNVEDLTKSLLSALVDSAWHVSSSEKDWMDGSSQLTTDIGSDGKSVGLENASRHRYR
jgi:hypothetical protein